VVSLFRPFVGLLVYICFAIIKPESLWPWSVPEGNYSRVVAVGLLIGWAIHGFGCWRLGKARAIVVAFACLWLWSTASALAASDQERGWYFVDNMFKILLPFLVGISLIDSVTKLRQVVWVIVVSQSFLALQFNLYFFHGYNYIKENGFAGMEEGSIAIGMVSALGLSIHLFFEADDWRKKAIAFLSCGLLAHVVLFSFSRGGMLGLISAGVATLIVIPKRPSHLIVLGLCGLMVLMLAGKEVVARFDTSFQDESTRDFSATSRLMLWGNCLDAMMRHPLLGLGPWNFPLAAHTYYGWSSLKEGHSLWLQMGAEVGIPGFVFLLAFYGFGLVRLWPLTRDGTAVPDPWLRLAARMVVTSTIGFAVAAQFISLWALELPYYAMLIGAAALKLHSVPADAHTSRRPRRPKPMRNAAPGPAGDWSPAWRQPRPAGSSSAL
jgi:O-antigen ligase